MKETRKFFTTMMAMMAMMAMALMLPMQVKAAEAAQPVVETENIQLVELKEGLYTEVEQEGIFEQYDEEGNLISSTKVIKSLFEVNADLTTGWGQGDFGDSFTKGDIKDITLDTKSYLRATFISENGVQGTITIKVKFTASENWDRLQRPCTVVTVKKNTTAVAGNTNKNTSVSKGSEDDSNDNSTGGDDGDDDPGNKGWEENSSDDADGDDDPGNKGW